MNLRKENRYTAEMDEEIREKLDFFWDDCEPEIEADVVDSIREKVLRRIRPLQEEAVGLPKRKSRKCVYLLVASVAASVAVLVGLWQSYGGKVSHANIWNAVAELESFPMEEAKDVTLVISDWEQYRLETDELVDYTYEDCIRIGSDALTQSDGNKRNVVEKRSAEDSYNQLIVPKGKRSCLLLSDGTKVHVNSGTKVVYPRMFSEKKREIYVEGEIYLEVMPDAGRPFYVCTDRFDVKVLGTSFDVFAYKQMGEGRVVLLQGAVEVEDRREGSFRMNPDEMVVFGEEGSRKEKVNASDYKAWVDGVMVLDGCTLKELATRLSLFFGKKVVCDFSLENEQIYGKLDLRDNPDEIMDYIKSMIPLSVYNEGGNIYLKRE